MSEVKQSAHLQITVAADGMTEAAKKRFENYVQRFTDDLSRETMRLEEGARAPDLDEREITATIVVKANEVVRRPPDPSNVSSVVAGPILAVQTFAFAAALVDGVLGSYLHSTWQWLAFVTTLVVAVSAQASSAYMLWRQR